MKGLSDLKIKIFADGADIDGILDMYGKPYIKGFTTNPTLMHSAGVENYEIFAKSIIKAVPDRPISFEVLSDDFKEMERQALKIMKWGENVFVKIPVTNTMAESSSALIMRLIRAGAKVNVTALTSLPQVEDMAKVLCNAPPAYISIFAGRIADSGLDPVPIMAEAVKICSSCKNIEIIWASPRELLNIFQADAIGCHIITVTSDILKKINRLGKDLHKLSLDTVKMFHGDALKAGYTL